MAAKTGIDMAIVVVIDEKRCTGCGLCVQYCSAGSLRISEELNERGVAPAEFCQEHNCTGCRLCVIMCPGAALTLYREQEQGAEAE